jgi:hypothetical protein
MVVSPAGQAGCGVLSQGALRGPARRRIGKNSFYVVKMLPSFMLRRRGK